jgi:hypothetical protein
MEQEETLPHVIWKGAIAFGLVHGLKQSFATVQHDRERPHIVLIN